MQTSVSDSLPPSVSPTTAASGLPGPVEVQPAIHQRTITVALGVGDSPTTAPSVAETSDAEVVLHLSIRCFVDHVMLFVTEAETCAPGVLLCHDAPAAGSGAFLFNSETPSLEVVVLLGLRDHPLTNLLASTIAHRLRSYGESRPLLMGLSVVQTAKKLRTGEAKKRLLDTVAASLLELAGAAPPSLPSQEQRQ